MNIDVPFRVGSDGRTAATGDANHVRDMIEILLFTQPGERVMRPDLGSGVLQFVHGVSSPEVAAALKMTVQAAMTQFLGDLIDVRALTIEAVHSELRVSMSYALRTTGEARVDTFVRSLA